MSPSIPSTASPSWPFCRPACARHPRYPRSGALYPGAAPGRAECAEVAVALDAAGVQVNRVTVYRLLDRFAAACLLQRQIDGARVTRLHWQCPTTDAAPALNAAAATGSFGWPGLGLHAGGPAPLLRTLAQAGHENLAVDIAVHGLCAGLRPSWRALHDPHPGPGPRLSRRGPCGLFRMWMRQGGALLVRALGQRQIHLAVCRPGCAARPRATCLWRACRSVRSAAPKSTPGGPGSIGFLPQNCT